MDVRDESGTEASKRLEFIRIILPSVDRVQMQKQRGDRRQRRPIPEPRISHRCATIGRIKAEVGWTRRRNTRY
jgi:hypothetical protein